MIETLRPVDIATRNALHTTLVELSTPPHKHVEHRYSLPGMPGGVRWRMSDNGRDLATAEARAYALGAFHAQVGSPDNASTAHVRTRAGMRSLTPAERSAYVRGATAQSRMTS